MSEGRTLRGHDLTYSYPGRPAPAVKGVELQVDAGQLVCVVGPNGSGKTTLLRLLAGMVVPDAGRVLLGETDMTAWNIRERARELAVVVQREEPAFPIKVADAVMMGRHPYVGPFGSVRPEDTKAVTSALRTADCESLADRWVHSLSGGEWQRVRIARALAQDPTVLLLDEATSNLDVRHEMETFELVSRLVRSRQLAALVVTHHVNLAARFADRLVVMKEGTVVVDGPPGTVLTTDVFESVFSWPMARIQFEDVPQFIPRRVIDEET